MIRLERNILDQANNDLRELEEQVLEGNNADRDRAVAAYHQLKAMFTLAGLPDSGMSDECVGMLEEIERRAGMMTQRLGLL
ncbi:hypothetical protein [Kushneria aurantia]|uniref:HPt domain-containing protein n=1 Tax=Kushneria aurantia TaxID=504092 RepID=A0ABV6FZE1_9GAMM|nr:hypothetical protein [Kushneria aurantia]